MKLYKKQTRSPLMAVLRERTFRHWLLSSLCIVMAFIISGVAVYMTATSLSEKTITRARNDAMRQTGSVIDDYLLSIREDIAMLANNERINTASQIGFPKSGADFYAYHKAGEECKGAYMYSKAENVFVYYNRGECFVDSYTLFYGQAVNSFISEKFQMDFSEWTSFANQSSFGRFHTFSDSIYYCCPLYKGGADGMILAQVDQSELRFLMESELTRNLENAETYIVSKDSSVILSLADIPEVPYAYGELSEGSNIIGSNVVTCYRFAQADWEYISIIPLRQYIPEIYHMKKIMYVYVLVGLLVGVYLVYSETEFRYRPLWQLSKKLAGNDADHHADTMFLLQNKVQEIVQENREMSDLLKKDQSLILDSQFSAILHLQYSEDEVQSIFKTRFDMSFDTGLVASVDITSISADEKDIDRNELVTMLLICLNNITSELLGSGYRCYFGEIDGIAGLIWSSSGKNFKEHVVKVLEQVKNSIREYFGIELRFSISNSFTDISYMEKALHQAKITKDFCHIVEENGIVSYEDSLTEPFSGWKNSVIVQAEHDFSLYMRDHNYTAAESKIKTIIEYYKLSKGISVQLLRCYMFGLVNLMLDAISLDAQTEDMYSLELDFPQRLLQADSISKLEHELIEILHDLIRNSHTEELSGKEKAVLVDRYIANHYADENLSVQFLADYFHLSVPYLSTMYKRYCQYGILEKIQTCRLKSAKELLCEFPDMPLTQVAYKSGFGNVQTMMRVFKKIENETPGKYREKHRKEEKSDS